MQHLLFGLNLLVTINMVSLETNLKRTASTGRCRCDSRGMMLVKACGGRLSGEYTGLLEEADNLGEAGTKNDRMNL